MKTLLRFALVAGSLCAAMPATAQWDTSYSIGGSYTGVKGNTIHASLRRDRENGYCDVYDISLPATTTVYLLPGGGTYPLLQTNIGSGWQPYYGGGGFEYWYMSVTIPGYSSTVNFDVPLVQDSNPDYDRTGTLLVFTTNCSGSTYSTAIITDMDNNIPIGVAIDSGGSLYNSAQILEGGLSGNNQATITFFRPSWASAAQSRTINYGTNSAASGDYSPGLGSITSALMNWAMCSPTHAMAWTASRSPSALPSLPFIRLATRARRLTSRTSFSR
jgi:hypothetical protein